MILKFGFYICVMFLSPKRLWCAYLREALLCHSGVIHFSGGNWV